MTLRLQILIIAALVIALIFIILQIRNRKLDLKYTCPAYTDDIPADPNVLLESGGIWKSDEHALRQWFLTYTAYYLYSYACCIEAYGSGQDVDTEGSSS